VKKSVARCRTGRGQLPGYYTRMRFLSLSTRLACLPALALTSCATGPTKMPDPGPMIDRIPHWSRRGYRRAPAPPSMRRDRPSARTTRQQSNRVVKRAAGPARPRVKHSSRAGITNKKYPRLARCGTSCAPSRLTHRAVAGAIPVSQRHGLGRGLIASTTARPRSPMSNLGEESVLNPRYASPFRIRDAGDGRYPRSISPIRASYSLARSTRRFSVKGSAAFARRRQRSACSFRYSGVMAANV
jgi:hypothetical protein